MRRATAVALLIPVVLGGALGALPYLTRDDRGEERRREGNLTELAVTDLRTRRWYSLPTEAEWEKAARGPDGLDYALSAGISDAEAGLYNWRKNPEAPVPLYGIGETAARFAPNRYGLYHMTGKVAEWTQSWHRPHNRVQPYADDERNHDDGSGARSVRGGSWYSAAISYLSIAYRDTFQPEHCSHEIGFRLVVRLLP